MTMTNEELIINYQKTNDIYFLNEFFINNQTKIEEIVYHTTKNFPYINQSDRQDLTQEVNLYIFIIIHKYNPQKNIKFFSFLEKAIKGKIYDLLPNIKNCTNISNYAWRKGKSYQKYIDSYKDAHNGILPPNQELEEVFGKNHSSLINTTDTLYCDIDDNKISNQMIVPDNTLDYVLTKDKIYTLTKCIDKLTHPFAKTILTDFIHNEKTLQETANTLGISKGRVCQIKKQLLLDLKNMEEIKLLA